MFTVQGLDHVGLAVRDVQRSAAWYQDVLGLKRMFEEVWGSYPAVVGMGNTSIALFPTEEISMEYPVGLPLRHVAFSVDRPNFKAAQETLKQRAIPFVFQDHKIAYAIYFSDPDGHLIEIMTYEL